MKELNQNLKNIRKFFNQLYYEENATREEVYNFLRECLTFVFNKNNLNLNDFKVNLHIVKELPIKHCDATMIADDKDETKFDIYLKSKSLQIKNYEDCVAFLYYIYVFIHECGHVIQYICHSKDMVIYDNEYLIYQDTLIDMQSTPHKTRDFRRATKGFASFFDSVDAISHVEKNANKQAYLNYKAILDELIMHEKDDELADYFASAYSNLQNIKKDDYIFYRKYHKIKKDALNTLKDYDFEETVVIPLD